MNLTFLTFHSPSYTSRAKVLIDSIKKYHPGSPIIVKSIQDGPETYPDNLCKVKYQWVLDAFEEGHENVILLGADMELFSRLESIEWLLHCYNDYLDQDPYDVILTPHFLYPKTDNAKLQQTSLVGHINSDFIVFRNCENSKNILKWLLEKPMVEDLKTGIFYDQTWVSMLPFLFDNVYILRDFTYNVAYWNVKDRGLNSLAVFHYSGYVKGSPEKMSKYCNTTCDGEILRIYQEYDKRI
jgi:hypothetical protein